MTAVSVIIPVYNRKKFLKTAVDSVLQQTFSDFELIIIDDGSEDKTDELVKEYSDQRIKYFYQFNRGPAAARNAGLKKAQGQYIAFLDSDDKWTEDKLTVQVSAMSDHPEFYISHTEEIWYKGSRLIQPKKIHKKESGDLFNKSLRLCCISPSSVMLKKGLINKVGYFDEKFEVCEDYEFWLRITARFPVLFIDKVLTVKQGGHFDQQSQKYFGLDKYRIFAIEKILKTNSLTKQQQLEAVKELEYKCRIYSQGCRKYKRMEEAEYYFKLPEQYKIDR